MKHRYQYLRFYVRLKKSFINACALMSLGLICITNLSSAILFFLPFSLFLIERVLYIYIYISLIKQNILGTHLKIRQLPHFLFFPVKKVFVFLSLPPPSHLINCQVPSCYCTSVSIKTTRNILFLSFFFLS